MVFVLELGDMQVSCCLLGLYLIVLCIDEEHLSILKRHGDSLLFVAKEEFGNELTSIRYYLERR
jgi:hypothetical protein